MVKPVATQHTLIHNHRIAHGIYGPPNATPLVLIHGTPSSSLIFRDLIPILNEGGYRVHVYDLLGFGLSERPADPTVDTSMSGQVPILLSLFDFWGLDKAHVFAHDIGGGVAQRFCIFHPERVRSLTMTNVVSFDSFPSPRAREQLKNGLEGQIHASDEEHRAQYRDFLRGLVVDEEKIVNSGALDTYLEYISGPVGQASFFQHQVGWFSPKHTSEVAGRYHELGRMRVKLIWGKEDPYQTIEWGRKLHEAIPGSEFDVLEGASHFSLEDKPGELVKLAVEFLKKTDESG